MSMSNIYSDGGITSGRGLSSQNHKQLFDSSRKPRKISARITEEGTQFL